MDKYLIIGASSEIGQEFIKRVLSEKKAEVFAHFRTKNTVFSQKMNGFCDRIKLWRADLSDTEQILEMGKALSEADFLPTHILFLAATPIKHRRIKDIEWADFESEINIEIRAAHLLLARVLPKMAKQKQGKILFMLSSCTGEITPAYMGDYVTAKYALLGYMKALSAEYSAKNIKINALSPDMVETKFLSEIDERIVEMNAMKRPSGKNLTPFEVAEKIDEIFENSEYTGANIFL